MGSTMPRNNLAKTDARRKIGREAETDALAAVEHFNQRMAGKKAIWSWPIIGAALLAKHHWLVCVCESCDTILDLDLRVKPRNPEASIRFALNDVRCPRCNGHGRTRLVRLGRFLGDEGEHCIAL